MPLLASVEGSVVFLVITAIIGLVNWLTQKSSDAEKSGESESDSRPIRRVPPRPVSQGDPDAERRRKFMEALGLPPDHVAPKPVRPKVAVPRPAIPPALPVGLPKSSRSGPPRFPVPPNVPTPVVKRVPHSAPPRQPSLDEQDAPSLPVEELFVPELNFSHVPEFETVSSKILASSRASGGLGEPDAYAAALPDHSGDDVRALLQSPRALRSAFLLREILGPPRSLQS